MTITEACKKTLELGLNQGTSGNISTRIDENSFLITPTNAPYQTLKEDDLVICNLDGNSKNGVPSSEWRLHAEIYKNFSNINSVVHTHSPKATEIAMKELPINPSIPCAPFAEFGTTQVGLSVIPYLRVTNTVLLGKHGTVAVGKDLDEAFNNAKLIEEQASF